MQAKLIVVGGDIGAAEIPLKLPAVIGRSRDATLTLPHPLVSRHHCEIFENNGRLMVRDLGSRNGTYVANERVTESILPSGELLTIGAVTFRAVYDDVTVNEHRGKGRDTTRPNRTVCNETVAIADSAIPLSDEELFREDDLADENFGVDSGHFGDLDADSKTSL
jgi:pSer/pThr/pTyr-binding forkhead associated (FHA) protein